MNWSDKTLDHRLNVSLYAGERGGLSAAARAAQEESSKAFLAKEYDLAYAFRQFADRLDALAKRAGDLQSEEQELFKESQQAEVRA